MHVTAAGAVSFRELRRSELVVTDAQASEHTKGHWSADGKTATFVT